MSKNDRKLVLGGGGGGGGRGFGSKSKNAFKLSNYHFACCKDENPVHFNYLNNKLFSHELKILNYDGLRETKKLSNENLHFDWIKLIHWY